MRESLGVSRWRLASSLGMSPDRLGRAERGELELRASEISPLAAALGVEVEELLTAVSRGPTAATKTCRTCGEVKPLDAFCVDGRAEGGRGAQCKTCKNKRVRATRAG